MAKDRMQRQRFGLMQCGAAKYCEGEADVGEIELGPALHHLPWGALHSEPRHSRQHLHEQLDD